MPNIEDAINRAIQEGKFDNLPGKGKPLRMDENPHEDPEWRVAHHMLRSAGFSLPWLETRHEIETNLEEARAGLARTWSWRQASLAEGAVTLEVEAEWRRAAQVFRERIIAINQLIFKYNLEVPSDRFQKRALNAEREIEKITGKQG